MRRILFTLLTFFLLSTIALTAADTPYLLVLNKSDHTAWQIHAETGEKVKSYPTDKGPHEVAVSPDRNWAVITNYGADEAGHSLTVLDLTDRAVEQTIDISPYQRPHGVDWFPDSRRVIVTAESQKAAVIVDIQSGETLRALPTNQNLSHMVALGPDARTAYVTNIMSGSVSVLDLQADSASQPTSIIKTGRGTEGIEILEQSRQGWFSNRSDHTISVINLQTLTPVDTLQSKGFPIRLAASPDEQWISVTHAKSSEVAIFDAETRQTLARIPLKQTESDSQKERFIGDRFGDGAVPIGVTFSDDGSRLYVSASQSDVVAVIDTKSWSVAETFKTGTEPDGIDFVRR